MSSEKLGGELAAAAFADVMRDDLETYRHVLGRWWAAVPKARWPDHAEWREVMQRNWHSLWGDRRQEIVFIGAGMDEAAIRARLDACLIDPAAGSDPRAWARLPDPFPVWRRGEAAA